MELQFQTCVKSHITVNTSIPSLLDVKIKSSKTKIVQTFLREHRYNIAYLLLMTPDANSSCAFWKLAPVCR